ncbi:MAG: hypothetical protein PHV92_00650 [Candidatus Omnitrophica bacterium]|jgi:hypothetical protein|nr:hypothetical protein [Candidatus Omnitrophota bacterium]
MNKDKIIVTLAVATLLLFVLNIGSCIGAYNQNSLRKKEMLQRMNLEEKAGKAIQEQTGLAEKIEARDKELAEEKANFEALKKTLVQEQLVSASLKVELDKVTKLKEALEEKLQKKSSFNKKAKK